MNEWVPKLKEKLDAGSLKLVAAVQLSYVSEDVQRAVAELDKPISKDMAVKIHEEGKTAEDVMQVVCRDTKKGNAYKNVRISAEVYEKYFVGMDREKISEIIEAVLATWDT